MNTKLVALTSGIAIAVAITSTFAYVKPIYPAEIIGRKLLLYGLGWTGQCGMLQPMSFDLGVMRIPLLAAVLH